MAIMARQLMCALLPIGCRILSHPMSIGRCKRRLARTCKLRCGGSLNKARSRVNGLDSVVAEREGFEPPIRLPVCRISSAVHSTSLAPLREAKKQLVIVVFSDARR